MTATTTRPPFFARPLRELRVGESWTSEELAVPADAVIAFAELTGDCHPVHVDPEWARTSRFGGQIAHGLLVLSLAIGAAPFDARAVVALRALREVVFKRPVVAGERVRVAAEVAEIAPVDAATGLVSIAVRVRDGRGRLAVRGTIEVLWRREAEA